MAIPEKGNFMTTKNVAEQLLVGSARLDQMWNDTKQLLNLIFSRKHEFGKKQQFQIKHPNKIIWIVNVETWKSYPESLTLDHSYIVVSCTYEKLGYEILKYDPTQGRNQLSNIESMYIKDVYESLGLLIDTIFNKFPKLKEKFMPLLNAGQ